MIEEKSKIVIIPHTHWDREWYLPFQKFRYKLVNLIDTLLDINEKQEYRFMLDGQTVVLEDYLEIKPENKDKLVKLLKGGRIAAGPWYLLPDEWLVSGESLIRNLEYSNTLAKRLGIPLMPVGYLPDQFGHTRAIPQILGDLTDFIGAVVYRGVGNDVDSVRFTWKAHNTSSVSILAIYLKGGYGNASRFPENEDLFHEQVASLVADLKPFSRVPVYLLMNGSDHLFPQPFVKGYIDKKKNPNMDISLGFLTDFIEATKKEWDRLGKEPPAYAGEFRSPARAPLLQDTYSARAWIKIWNQKVDDKLVSQAEPLATYAWFHMGMEYPAGFFETAWKWHLRNQPHDSICGCSIDQTHEEMKGRYLWAESIADTLVEHATDALREAGTPSRSNSILVFNQSACAGTRVYAEVNVPGDIDFNGFQLPDGSTYPAQKLTSKGSVLVDMTVGGITAKTGLKMLPGREIMGYWINKIEARVGDKPNLLELRVEVDTVPVGDIDIEPVRKNAIEILGEATAERAFKEVVKPDGDINIDAFKKIASEIINSKKYSKFHLIASRPTKNIYGTVIPLKPLGFTKLVPVKMATTGSSTPWQVDKNAVSNQFYDVRFNKDGTLSMQDKQSGVLYPKLHVFEDWGDRGDEYTFGRLGPEQAKVGKVTRNVIFNGPIFATIRQDAVLTLFEGLNASRDKREGKVEMKVESTFRFYKDLPRIDVTTKLVNTARDHRLRVCFDMPFATNHTHTATHFGCITRQGEPEKLEAYEEQPSGIQAQKRYVRVNSRESNSAFTVMNKGMPEVELVGGTRLAITLLRAIGWLSRSDFPERPMHAGPGEETPGAQELGKEYEFTYGFMAHLSKDPMHVSEDHADAMCTGTSTIPYIQAEPPASLDQSIMEVDSAWIRVSSLRVRDGAVLVTLYNLADKEIQCAVKVPGSITKLNEIKIDGKVKNEHVVKNGAATLVFMPHEIKMCRLVKK